MERKQHPLPTSQTVESMRETTTSNSEGDVEEGGSAATGPMDVDPPTAPSETRVDGPSYKDQAQSDHNHLQQQQQIPDDLLLPEYKDQVRGPPSTRRLDNKELLVLPEYKDQVRPHHHKVNLARRNPTERADNVENVRLSSEIPLVSAHIVEEEDEGESVPEPSSQQPPPHPPPPKNTCRSRAILGAGVLLAVVAGGAVGGIIVSQSNGSSPPPPTTTATSPPPLSTPVPTNSTTEPGFVETEPPTVPPPTPAPIPLTTIIQTNPPTNSAVTRPFETTEELYQAADAFMSNPLGFASTNLANTYGSKPDDWDVSRITNFSRVWDIDRSTTLSEDRQSGTQTLDMDLRGWNVSRGITMRGMFAGTSNQNAKEDLSMWDVSRVQDMSYMFLGATFFDGNISTWQTGNVESMDKMFSLAINFNEDISGFDVSKVKSFVGMFNIAISFNQNLSRWSPISASNMTAMFNNANAFDQNLCGWAANVPENATVASMFAVTKCAKQDDPVVQNGTSPYFCQVC